MNLSIIIPVFNEQETILTVLGKINNLQFPPFVQQVEIIVVDDCSKDDTGNLISNYHSTLPISIYRHEINKGKGAAVRTGFQNAKGDVFLIQDADLELSPEDIPNMIFEMQRLGVEFVNGSRYMSGLSRPLSSYKRYMANRFFTFLTSVLINVKLTDMACGYKLIHRNLAEKLNLRENRFGFEAEMIIKALRVKRNNVTEVPVNYFPRNDGGGKKLKNTDGFKIFWTVILHGLFRAK